MGFRIDQHSLDRLIRAGSDANRSTNIAAGKAVAESVRATLGPRGMDKMIVDSMGDVVITDDGATILTMMELEHPAARLFVEIAELQTNETGDGTTTAVLLAGALLAQAEDLLDEDIHATIIAQGYRAAAEEASQILEENAIEISAEDRDALEQVAATAMTGMGVGHDRDLLAELVVSAVLTVWEEDGVDTRNIEVETVVGGSVDQSELVEGVIVDGNRADDSMPHAVGDANIALLDTPIEVIETDIDTEVNVTDPDQLQQFLDREENHLEEMVDKLVDVGADVVFCQHGIDYLAQYYLADRGVLAVSRTMASDMKRLARATGGTVVSSIDEITAEDLGFAGYVVETEIDDEPRILVEDGEAAASVTLIIRTATEHAIAETERAVDDSLGVVRISVEDGTILPGGGAPEMLVSTRLHEYAASVDGDDRRAIVAFADALEVIPRTLAENVGADPVEVVDDLRMRHADGETTAGVDATTGEISDMAAVGVFEPLRVKMQAVEHATEAAVRLLHLDDVIYTGSGDLSGVVWPGETPLGGIPAWTTEEEDDTAEREAERVAGDERTGSVFAPEAVLPGQGFHLTARWSGELPALLIALPPEISLGDDEVRRAVWSREEDGHTEILLQIPDDLAANVLRIPLTASENSVAEIEPVEVVTEFVFLGAERPIERTAIQFLSPVVEITAPESLELRPDADRPVLPITLRNHSIVPTDVRVGIRAVDGDPDAGLSIVSDEEGARMAEGLLNIGLHDWGVQYLRTEERERPVELETRDTVSEPDLDVLRRGCTAAMEYLSRDEGSNVPGYSSDDISALLEALRLLTTEGTYELLYGFLPDVRRTVLESELARRVSESITVKNPIKYVEIPTGVSQLEFTAEYWDERGHTYPETSTLVDVAGEGAGATRRLWVDIAGDPGFENSAGFSEEVA